MSSNDNIPKKGDLIINPKTSRPVKVGGRAWLNLVREGLVSGQHQDPNELYELKEDDNVEEKIQELNKELPINQQSVRGRGKYKNKIVKRNKQPSTREITQHTARKTAHKLKDKKVYEQLHEAEDFELELENLIMAELANINNQQPTPVRSKRGSIKQHQQQEEYYTQEVEPDSETELEDEDEDETEMEEYYE